MKGSLSTQEILNDVYDATNHILNAEGSTYTGNKTITGNLTITGSLNFGDASTDILTITGYIRGAVSGLTYISLGTGTPGNLGTPQIDDVFIKGRLEVDGNLYADGKIYASAIERVTGGALNITLGSATGDDFIIDTTGFVYEGDTNRVGIGTATPLQKLDIEKGHIRLGQVAASSAPTVAIGAAGVLTGNYYYRISFVTALGETESGAVSALVAPAAQQVNLSAIPVSSDSAVISRKIYRTVANGGWPYNTKLVTTINDNTTTIYSDNIADASLGVFAPTFNTTGGLIYNGNVRAGIIDNATTAIGINALRMNTGYYNSAMGVNALLSNTTGNYNSAMGMNALLSNTTGNYNSAMGVNALLSNTTGNYNSAMGMNAILSNTTGNYNSAMGVNALYSNTTGNYNSAIGMYALYSNTTGNYNSAIGMQTLYYNTTGNYNSAMGVNALLSNTTGNYNSAMGVNALLSNTTGSNNTALGYQAGDNLTTGANNIIIGYNIDAPLATSVNTLNIGNLLFGTGIDGTGTTLSSGNIGIGTTSPSALLNLKGNLSSALTGIVVVTNLSTAVVGVGTLFTIELAVGDSIKIGTEVFTVSVITDALNLTLDSAYQGTTASGLTAYRDPTLFAIDNGDAINKLTITKSGYVGIGTTVPIDKLQVDGNIFLSSGNKIWSRIDDNAGWNAGIILFDGVGDMYLINRYGESAAKGRIYFQTSDTTDSPETRMIITKQGNVGIGTMSPTSLLTVAGPISTQAPATKTAAYSMIATDSSLIFNGTASIILTLQAASSWTGRILYVKTIAAWTVDSASANVAPLGSATAGTAILAATAGKWAMLQSDGTNWVIMAGN